MSYESRIMSITLHDTPQIKMQARAAEIGAEADREIAALKSLLTEEIKPHLAEATAQAEYLNLQERYEKGAAHRQELMRKLGEQAGQIEAAERLAIALQNCAITCNRQPGSRSVELLFGDDLDRARAAHQALAEFIGAFRAAKEGK